MTNPRPEHVLLAADAARWTKGSPPVVCEVTTERGHFQITIKRGHPSLLFNGVLIATHRCWLAPLMRTAAVLW